MIFCGMNEFNEQGKEIHTVLEEEHDSDTSVKK